MSVTRTAALFASVCVLSGCAGAPRPPAAPPVPPPAPAPAPVELAPALRPLAFLLGTWTGSGSGRPGLSTGGATFTPVAQGHAIERRAFNDSAEGRHEDVLLVYEEPGRGLVATYVDGEGHVIRYGLRLGEDGRSVVFESPSGPQAPGFRLSYQLRPDDALFNRFEIARPGTTEFTTYVEGTLRRRA